MSSEFKTDCNLYKTRKSTMFEIMMSFKKLDMLEYPIMISGTLNVPKE